MSEGKVPYESIYALKQEAAKAYAQQPSRENERSAEPNYSGNPEEAGPISNELSRLHADLEKIGALLNEFERRVEPVLIVRPLQDIERKPDDKVEKSHSALYDHIVELRNIAGRIGQRINHLIQSSEV